VKFSIRKNTSRQRTLLFCGVIGFCSPDVCFQDARNYILETAAKNGFRFDTVQMLLNLMDACFRSSLMPRLREQEIGVVGMKTFGGADGIILKSKTFERSNVFIIRSIFQTSVVITGIDKRVEASKRHRDLLCNPRSGSSSRWD
jgi:hypothetical protein